MSLLRVVGPRTVRLRRRDVLARALLASATLVALLGSPVGADAPDGSAPPTWTMGAPATTPGDLTGAATATDTASGQLVLFGGTDDSGVVRSGTWIWDGSIWTEASPATSPPARTDASLAFDAAQGDLVLFGGTDATGQALDDTWTWDGNTWTQQSPNDQPPARSAAGVGYESGSQQVVLFGGTDATGLVLDDTWTWDGSTWTQQDPTSSPSGRTAPSLTGQTLAGGMLLFGGSDANGDALRDTWVWDGTDWTEADPLSSPPGRAGAGMTFDSQTGEVVLFGGTDSSGDALADTWSWDGTTWTESSPATSPPARSDTTLSPDPLTGDPVVFGGTGTSGGVLGDTWSYGSPPATVPGAPTVTGTTAGNGQITVSFDPPASDGGAPVTGYTVTATDLTTPANGGQSVSGSSSPLTLTGLTDGDGYTVAVVAANAVGTGPPSAASAPVVPATVPGAPTVTGTTAGNGQITVSFDPPASDGGAPVTGYTVTATDLTTPANGGQSSSGSSSPLTLTGLTDGNTYVAQVVATNEVGPGPASGASGTARPSGVLPTAFTWPEFHGAPALTGTSGDPTISATSAAGLGVRWMAPVGSALDSPVVAADPALGRVLAYVGNANGSFEAVDASTGALVWSDYFGSGITSTPLVDNGSVWVAPQNGNRVFKLDAATGATQCSLTTIGSVVSSPVGATPPGGTPTVFVSATSTGAGNGAIAAYNEGDCAEEWSWSGFVSQGSNWSPLSYGVTASGTGLLVFGSDNPDSEVYALDASTGTLAWHFATYCPLNEDWDVGAGPDISAPGINGFADGVAYVEGKDGIFYALDLTNGSLVWSYNFGGNGPTNPIITQTGALSTPALSGRTLVFGDTAGLYALDAVTGKKLWVLAKTGSIDSSPAIVGPAGNQVVAFGSQSGYFQVASLVSGKLLYRYKTGNFISPSPADVNGTLMIASYDGFLYDFGLGGANGDAPTTQITGPTSGQVLANPGGTVAITGTASVADGVGSVTLQIQEKGAGGLWYHAATGSFSPGPATVAAVLAAPGATTTAWSFPLPVPAQGAQYQVVASAVGRNGIADITGYTGTTSAASLTFAVLSAASAPVISGLPARVAPGAAITIGSSGFASGEVVTFTAPTSTGASVTLATVQADVLGDTPPRRVVISVNSAFGPDPITATGRTSRRIGTGSVYVSNDDDQFGYGPQHQGAEPNDTVIARYRGVTQKLAPGWSAPVSAGSDTTPAISRGIVYFGDRSGVFHAVAETTGRTVFTLQEDAAIESSPAVDSGAVFFGDDGGTVRSVDAGSGALLWSTSVGGSVGTPTVAGGTVYVGTSDGTLVAIAEGSGTVEWTDSIGGSVVAAPAVDTGTGTVVVTSTSAWVEAVASNDGVELWGRSIDGAATGAMVYGGRVYVGTSAGSVVALGESDGSVQWTATATGAVLAPPILAFGSVAVGDDRGAVSYFNPVTGALSSIESQFGHPITGLAYAGSDILLTSSSGAAGIIQTATYLLMDWTFTSAAGYYSPGVLLNGDVFILGDDGMLRAFTTPGRAVA